MENKYHVVLFFLAAYFFVYLWGKAFPVRRRRRGDYSGGSGDGLTGIYDGGHSFSGFSGDGGDGGSCGGGGHGGGDGGSCGGDGGR